MTAMMMPTAPLRMSLMPAHTRAQSPLRSPDTTRTMPRIMSSAPFTTARSVSKAAVVIATIWVPKRAHRERAISATLRKMSPITPTFFVTSPRISAEAREAMAATAVNAGPRVALSSVAVREIAGSPSVRNQSARSVRTGISFIPMVSLVSSKMSRSRAILPSRVFAFVAA